jgi:hypothetical protein
MSMSNDTIANFILSINRNTIDGRAKIDALLAVNPDVAKVKITYTYTREWGSDGCWDSQETGTCTVRQWVNGIESRHPGNRTYGFQPVGVAA